jgi:ribosome-binding factor A
MALSNKQREQLRALCGELGDEDGLSPADARRGSLPERDHKHVIKQLRLCEQVRRELSACLAECPDALLAELEVLRVEPGRRISQLTVVVTLQGVNDNVSTREILRRLKQVEGWLRTRIAPAISRKRVPQLSFSYGEWETPEEGGDVE